MPLIIDGYNLIHTAGILGRGVGPGSLHRARLALLNFLAEAIEPKELVRTTVVFDSHGAPGGLPREVTHRGITVRFAAQYEAADDLIEELIRADSAPRRLVVVSSDHRVQRAARRRKANAIDSDRWFVDLNRTRHERLEAAVDSPARPPVPLLTEDVEYWLRQFGGESALTDLLSRAEAAGPAETAEKPSDDKGGLLDNPFPPGYAEDLLENEEL